MITQTYLTELTHQVVGAAIEVHKALGSGLLERVYHRCMEHELTLRKIPFVSELYIPIHYKGVEMDTHLRCDLYIDNCFVAELKAEKQILPIYEAQLLTYMKLLKAPKGILINFFSTNIFKEGQKTYVNEYFRNLPA